MPCSDGGVPYPPSAAEIATANFNKRSGGLLCSACRSLERLGYDFDENPELADWWATHKREDDARMAREAAAEEREKWEIRIVKDALKKTFGELSKEEKSILKKRGYL